MATVEDLGKKVKAKYPGQYDDLPDIEVGQKVKAKFPDSYGDFTDVTATPGRSIGEALLNAPAEALAGVGAGVGSTVRGAYNLARTAVPAIPPAPEFLEKWATPPPTLAGKAGKFVEQMGEFFIPAGAIGKGAKAIEAATTGMRGAKALQLAGRAGMEAAGAGAVGAVQSGSPSGAVAPAAAAGVTTAALPPIAKLGTKAAGLLTGVGSEAAEQVAKGAPETVAAMRGQIPEVQIIKDFRDALQKVRDVRGINYRSQLAQLSSAPIDAAKYAPVRSAIMQELDNFGVKVTKKGLDFSRSTLPEADRKAVQDIINDVASWGSKPDDLTPLGLDTLKRRIDNHYTTGEVGAFVQRAKHNVRQFINREVPGYSKMTKDYEKASTFINQVEQDLVSKSEGTMSRKIFPALKQNNEYRKTLIEALEQYSPRTLKGEISGHAMSTALPRGLMGPLSGQALLMSVMTGTFGPSAAVGLALSSPRVMGELLNAMGKIPASGIPRITAGATSQFTIPPAPQ